MERDYLFQWFKYHAIFRWNTKAIMSKWQDHRSAVIDTLKRRGLTRYWLAKQLASTMSRNSIYGYLAGDFNVDYAKQHQISKVLGLRYTDE